MKYKTLSVKQPWSYLLCSGIKNIENRTWKLSEKYRDEWVLIHVSTNIRQSIGKLLTQEQLYAIKSLPDKNKASFFNGRQVEHAIIGAVKYSDCVINHPSIWAEKTEVSTSWGKDLEIIVDERPIFNWVVSDAVLFDKPILNVKGKLSFWDYDLPEEYDKFKQKQALIDMMRGDEELGLYDDNSKKNH